MKWFRVYSEMVQDRKLRRLSVEHRWLWIAVLAAASESPLRGRLLVADDEPITLGDLADAAGIALSDVEAGVAAFERQDMLHWDGNVLVVSHWQQRQPNSDNVTERTRAFRERSQSNTETFPSRALATEAEAEVDTEADTETPPASSRLRACDTLRNFGVTTECFRRSLEAFPEFDNPDLTAIALDCVTYHATSPPKDRNRAWLNWLKKQREIEHERTASSNGHGRTRTRPTARRGAVDPASQTGGDPDDPSLPSAYTTGRHAAGVERL